ncbi:MAG: hypothetical protein AAGG07_00035 [Planctomycetota bacterium]
MSPRNRRILQLVGYLGALGLMAWAGKIVLSDDNREALDRLGEAGAPSIAGLVALAVGSLIANGLAFWLVIRPVRKIDALGVISVNAVATLLAYLPFKLSIVARATVHKARDGLPVVMTGAWMAATSATVLIGLGAAGVSAWLLGSIGWVFGLLTAVIAVTCIAATVWGGRFISGREGLHRLRALARAIRLSAITEKVMRTGAFRHAHDGAGMLASPIAMGGAVVARLADIALTSARFAIAAAAVGVSLDPAGAVALAIAYFVTGATSPVGMVGTREAAAVATASVFGLGGTGTEHEAFLLVALVVTAAELVTALGGAALGFVLLGPSAFRGKGLPPSEAAGEPDPNEAPSTPTPTIAADADRAGANEPDGR